MPFTSPVVRFLVLAAFAVSASCDDGTAPAPAHVEVTIVATSDWNAYGEHHRSSPRLWCEALFTAHAHGTSNGTAYWQDGILRRHIGLDQSLPYDSVYLGVGLVRQIMGGDFIRAGWSPTGGMAFESDVPIGVSGELRYDVDGDIAAAPFRFQCGPALDPDAPPPTITSLHWSDHPVEPGKRIVLHYEAASSIGLWSTTFVVEGAIRDSIEWTAFLDPVISDSISFPIPAGATLGDSITVTMTARDAALRPTSARVVSTPIVDVSPPGQGSLGIERAWDANGLQFSVGDTLTLTWSTSDNGTSVSIIWQVGDPIIAQDSVVVQAMHGALDLAAPEAWLGAHPIHARLRDAGGNLASFALDDSVWIYPVVETRMHTATLPTEYVHAGAVADFARDRLYLLDGGIARVFILSLPDMAVLDEIALPSTAGGFALSPDGLTMLVTQPLTHAVVAFDTRSPTVHDVIPLTAVDSMPSMALRDVAVTADGTWLVLHRYVGYDPYALEGTVVALDLPVGSQSIVEGPSAIGRLFGSADGGAVYLAEESGAEAQACMRRWTGTGFADCALTSGYAGSLHVEGSADGSRWATPAGYFDASWQPLGGPVLHGVLSAPAPADAGVYYFNGPRLYLADPGTQRIGFRAFAGGDFEAVVDLLSSPHGDWLIRIAGQSMVRVTLVEIL